MLLDVLVAVIAIAAVVLTLLALDHVRARPADGEVSPPPSFSQPASPSPSPSPTETTAGAASYDRSQERFLAASAGTLWRGVAGQCGVAEPLLERSADGGKSWTDATPRYLGIGQLVALDPFADGQAEIVALTGTDCEAQTLRTFTQGQFWESNPEVHAASRYVDPTDTSRIVSSGATVAASCSDPRSLRASGTTLATVCGGVAHVLDAEDEWMPLPPANVAAVNFDGDDVLVAHLAEQCTGITISRFASEDAAAPQSEKCVEAAEPSTPTALAVAGTDLVVWSGAETATVTP
ncbi:hypothetical protein CW368_09325 [Actinomycetales bacterium SN12]|nr:hypothetical protein CW368_09325 [Actinomycetales bacterium SN12]